jgi:hypothetical protein
MILPGTRTQRLVCLNELGQALGVQKLNSATPLIQRHQGGSSWNLCITSDWIYTS